MFDCILLASSHTGLVLWEGPGPLTATTHQINTAISLSAGEPVVKLLTLLRTGH